MIRTLSVLLATGLCTLAHAADKPSTAAPNVQILVPIAMPGLDRQRTLRVYLPPSYDKAASKHYPVLYMHDGQNLFDAATSYAGEWGVDETLNELARTQGLELIVVGIDNGGEKRMSELNAYPNERMPPPEGVAYMRFVVEVVKPLIDRRFRTRPQREHTAIMGSSLGGVISHYAINQYPQVFSRAGLFSSAYRVNPQLFVAAAKPLPADARVYLFAGGREGGNIPADAIRMFETLKAANKPQQLELRLEAAADHNEAAWRAEFPRAVRWLFGQR